MARLDALLRETTASHLQSDVPYGACLSGGADSSSIVTRMAKIDGVVESFTLDFEAASVGDERGSAARLAARGGSGKYLLKSRLSGRHPTLDGWGRKHGFTVPIRDWQERRRSDLAAHLASHDGLMTFVDRTAPRRWLERPVSRRAAVLLFRLVVFALRHARHIEGRAPTKGRFPTPTAVGAQG